MSHSFETLLYAVFFTVWIVRLYYKLYDKKNKGYILSIGILIIFWMFIRIFKSAIGVNALERYSWYMYYLPLIFIPALYYISCSGNMTKLKKSIIYMFSSILFLMVLTNDLHQKVFIFTDTLSNYDVYKHNVGYYIVSVWIFALLGAGMIKLVINRFKVKKDLKAFLPLFVLLIGVIYTALYVMDFKSIRNVNMSVFNSMLICTGIELALYLDLIPNNKKYVKTFENSSLNMAVISKDTNIFYTTTVFKKIPDFIINDIKTNKIRKSYKDKNLLYKIKNNGDSFTVEMIDLKSLYKLRKEVKEKKKMLLLQQETIKLEEKTKRELYEIKLRKEIVSKVEKTLEKKWKEAKKILEKKNVTFDDLERIKYIIIYNKKKTNIILSALNDESFNNASIKSILNDLVSSINKKVNSCVVIGDGLNLNGYLMSCLFDSVYEVVKELDSNTLMLYVFEEKSEIKLKMIIDSNKSIMKRINALKDVSLTEKIYDTDAVLIFSVKKGGSL